MSDPTLNVQYVPMSLTQHDSKVVAELIHQSDPTLFNVMFGQRSIGHLTGLVERSHNPFSHRYIRVAAIAHQVVGIVTLVPTDRLSEETEDYRSVFNFGRQLWLTGLKLVVRRILRQDYPPSSLYIGNLVVAEPFRGQGIGRQLLSACITEAKAQGSSLFISVDIDNPRAQKLYESLGFQVAETKTLRLFGTTIGSRSLSLPAQQ
ncbi:MAG: GNAT family N-acetyltransferase [Cyanothece sp. SIO2G6]|nr:GNAT family N-acetyltransferase [Cyanothece sp. SIO2G6]